MNIAQLDDLHGFIICIPQFPPLKLLIDGWSVNVYSDADLCR